MDWGVDGFDLFMELVYSQTNVEYLCINVYRTNSDAIFSQSFYLQEQTNGNVKKTIFLENDQQAPHLDICKLRNTEIESRRLHLCMCIKVYAYKSNEN